MPEKIELRKEIAEKAKEILADDNYRICHSREICNRIFASPEYKTADVVFAYMPLHDEVDLSILIADAFANGKKVAFPRVDDSNKTIAFWFITPETKLESGQFGILEPPIKSKENSSEAGDSKSEISTVDVQFSEPVTEEFFTVADSKSKKILALIPGRAFTKDGKRLGRGGGYYDRFLQEFGDKLTKIGVCFPFQILDDIPTIKTDYKVDRVISE